MTINTESWALQDLFAHVVSNRANVGEIDALIQYLQERRQVLAGTCNGKQGYCTHKPKWIYNNRGIDEYYCGYCARQFIVGTLRPIEAQPEGGEG